MSQKKLYTSFSNSDNKNQISITQSKLSVDLQWLNKKLVFSCQYSDLTNILVSEFRKVVCSFLDCLARNQITGLSLKVTDILAFSI